MKAPSKRSSRPPSGFVTVTDRHECELVWARPLVGGQGGQLFQLKGFDRCALRATERHYVVAGLNFVRDRGVQSFGALLQRSTEGLAVESGNRRQLLGCGRRQPQ
jgi:hypothetical protein